MKRRALLAGASVGIAGLAGCLEGSNEHYEQCDREIIPISWLPDSAQEEVDAALEDGEYVTWDGLTLAEAVDTDDSVLQNDENDYFETKVDEGLIRTTVRLEETYPPADETVDIRNVTEDELKLDVRIEREDTDQVLVDKTVELSSGERHSFGRPDLHYGRTYRTLVGGDGRSEEVEWQLRLHTVGHHMVVLDDELSVGATPHEVLGCQWDDDGNLTDP